MSGGGGYSVGDPDAIKVPFSDDESEEQLVTDEDKPGESPEERKARRERRQERLQTKLREGKQAKEELERERQEKQELRERLARLEGAVAATSRQQPASDGKDPFEAELDAIYAEQQSAYQAAQAELAAGGGKMPPERVKHYERVARDIDSRRSRVHARREIALTEPIRQQTTARQQWEQKHPEVYSNPRAYEYAEGRFKQRRAMGETITNAVVDEIMEEAKVQFKLGGKPAPSASERARLSGTASSGSGGGGSKEPIALSKNMRKIAVAAYDHLSEEEAIKAWTAKTGKRMRERKLL